MQLAHPVRHELPAPAGSGRALRLRDLLGIVLLVGLLCGCLNYALILILWSLFAGLAAAYGGKRSENGKRIYQDLLGLRRHMKKVSKAELIRILRTNPYYYYELAPFAIAMGVDKQLAARFDNLHIPNCSWLLSGSGRSTPQGNSIPFCGTPSNP